MSERRRNHEEFQTDLAAYALGSLDPDEQAALEEHLRDCPECQVILADYEQVVTAYPLTLPERQPPEGALDRLLERARAGQGQVPVTPDVIDHRMRYLWAGFAGLAALLLVMLGWNIWLQINADSDSLVDSSRIAIVLPLTGTENAGDASGHLVMDEEWDECALVASGLPPLDADHDYQLWFVSADGSRKSGAVFHPNDAGQISVDVDVPENWRDFEQVGITAEPAGGSPGPTGPAVLSGGFAGSR